MKRTIALAALVLARFTSAAYAQGLPTLGDTFFAQGNNSNFGTSPTINVGGAGSHQGLVQFDTAGLPSGITGASVAKASLVLFVNKIGSAGAVNINAANGPWTEGAVNGNNAPATGMIIASSVPVNTAGVYITVDATALVKDWLDAKQINSGVIISADPASPGTSVFFDSKESASTSHPAMLQVTLTGGGATGPAGPVGPAGATGATGPQGLTGLTGPAGPAVAPLFTRATLTYVVASVPPAGVAPNKLATLTFTPGVNGTAILSGRGSCNMKALFSLSQINVAAGLSAAQAFSAPVSDWGFMSVPAGQPAGGYLGNFTTQSTMPVVANTT